MFGLPDRLYGFPLVVEASYYVSTKKGATTSKSAVLATGTPFMAARPGGIEGAATGPSFSTIAIFEYENMTVETLRDAPNRRSLIRVVDDFDVEVVAPVSGILFQNAG